MIDTGCNGEMLSAYIDGELSAQDTKIVQSHLDCCPRCEAFVEQTRALSGSVWSIPRPEVSPLFQLRVMQMIASDVILNRTALVNLLESWGILSLVFGILLALIITPVFYFVTVIIRQLITLISLAGRIIGQLPLDSSNAFLGLVLLIGASIAFYGFYRVYESLNRERVIV